MSSRREYRSVYVDLWEDDEFLALSRTAKGTFRYLKDTAGAIGLRKVSLHRASSAIGCTRAELEADLEELAACKEGRQYGWIVRDGDLIWIVNGLRWEPTLSVGNGKHRTYVRGELEALDAGRDVVQLFRAHYADWLGDSAPAPDAPPEPNPTPSDTHSDATGEGIDSLSVGSDSLPKHSYSTSNSNCDLPKSRSVGDLGEAPRAPASEPAAGADRPTEGGASAGTAPTPGSSAPPGHAVLEHPDVMAWRERFYCASTTARLADVDAQLVAAVSEAGAPTDDRRVARCTPDVLAGLAGDMAASRKQPDDPEAAVVWLLRNVADGKVPKAHRVAAVATVRAEQRQAAATAHRATLPDPAARSASELLEGRRLIGRFAEDYPAEHARLYARAKQHAPRLHDTAAVAAAIEGMLIPLVSHRLAEMRQAPTPQADSESATHALVGATA